jgi:DNA-binding XRE family transcriptional regulator
MAKTRGLEGLRYFRQRAALTQQQLADMLNIHRATVIAWEAGQSWPSAALLPKLADLLLCTIDDLYIDFTVGEEASQCPRTEEIFMDATAERQV